MAERLQVLEGSTQKHESEAQKNKTRLEQIESVLQNIAHNLQGFDEQLNPDAMPAGVDDPLQYAIKVQERLDALEAGHQLDPTYEGDEEYVERGEMHHDSQRASGADGNVGAAGEGAGPRAGGGAGADADAEADAGAGTGAAAGVIGSAAAAAAGGEAVGDASRQVKSTPASNNPSRHRCVPK